MIRKMLLGCALFALCCVSSYAEEPRGGLVEITSVDQATYRITVAGDYEPGERELSRMRGVVIGAGFVSFDVVDVDEIALFPQKAYGFSFSPKPTLESTILEMKFGPGWTWAYKSRQSDLEEAQRVRRTARGSAGDVLDDLFGKPSADGDEPPVTRAAIDSLDDLFDTRREYPEHLDVQKTRKLEDAYWEWIYGEPRRSQTSNIPPETTTKAEVDAELLRIVRELNQLLKKEQSVSGPRPDQKDEDFTHAEVREFFPLEVDDDVPFEVEPAPPLD